MSTCICCGPAGPFVCHYVWFHGCLATSSPPGGTATRSSLQRRLKVSEKCYTKKSTEAQPGATKAPFDSSKKCEYSQALSRFFTTQAPSLSSFDTRPGAHNIRPEQNTLYGSTRQHMGCMHGVSPCPRNSCRRTTLAPPRACVRTFLLQHFPNAKRLDESRSSALHSTLGVI